MVIHLQMQLTFDFIGDSHLARLVESGVRFPCQGRCRFFSRKGAKINFLEDTTRNIIRRGVADVTVIFIGGNDIDNKYADVRDLAERYAAAANSLQRKGSLVMIMDQWKRPGARAGECTYTTNLEYFNYIFPKLINFEVWQWEWGKRIVFNKNFFYKDGVHCTRFQYRKVARYLGAAAIAAARRLCWQLYY